MKQLLAALLACGQAVGQKSEGQPRPRAVAVRFQVFLKKKLENAVRALMANVPCDMALGVDSKTEPSAYVFGPPRFMWFLIQRFSAKWILI